MNIKDMNNFTFLVLKKVVSIKARLILPVFIFYYPTLTHTADHQNKPWSVEEYLQKESDQNFKEAAEKLQKIEQLLQESVKQETEEKEAAEKFFKEQELNVKRLIERFINSQKITLLVLNEQKKMIYKTMTLTREYSTDVLNLLANPLSKYYLQYKTVQFEKTITQNDDKEKLSTELLQKVKKGDPFILIKNPKEATISFFGSNS